MSEKNDLRNPLAKARDKFFASLDASFLSGSPTGIYLKNRIEHAFLIGYDAGKSDAAIDTAMRKETP